MGAVLEPGGARPEGVHLSELRVEAGEAGPVEWATASRPIAGEADSGDCAFVRDVGDAALAAMIDGLGHGPHAHRAASAACEALAKVPLDDLPRAFAAAEGALRRTRGAVMSAALVRPGAVEWAGVGNVAGLIVRRGGRAQLVPRGGILGVDSTAPRVSETPFERGDVLVLATDGIRAAFVDDVGVLDEPTTLARKLLRLHARENDDACVLVATLR